MNIDRVLRVLNCFCQLCGYQLHWFEQNTHRFRFTFWGVAYYIGLALTYAISVNQHFEKSAFLTILQDISPFLTHMMHIHLLLGLKIMLFTLYQMRCITNAANGLLEILPKIYARSFGRNEAYAYFLIFSTFVMILGFGLYIAIEMRFELPPLVDILVGLALFIPHFLLACSLKLYNVGSWMMSVLLQDLSDDFEILTGHTGTTTTEIENCTENTLDTTVDEKMDVNDEEVKITELETKLAKLEENTTMEKETQTVILEMSVVPAVGVMCNLERDLEKPLQQICKQVKQFFDAQQLFEAALEKQLNLLFGLNSHCIFSGCYALVFFKSYWNVIFSERSKRIILAANYGIYAFIFWDYLCLCLTSAFKEKIKMKFSKNISLLLKKKSQYSKSTRSLLKNIQSFLREAATFKLIGLYNFSVANFITFQTISGITIAITVIYKYLRNEIDLLNTSVENSLGE